MASFNLFDLLKGNINPESSTSTSTTSSQVIEGVSIQFSLGNEIIVNKNDINEGLTLFELFEKYQNELGIDVDRISKYKKLSDNSLINDGATPVELGESYRAFLSPRDKA